MLMAVFTRPRKLAVSLALPFLAGAIGSFVTFANLSSWYAALTKPSFNPPNWIFGPVWTALYIVMGVSLYIVWTKKYRGSKRLAFIIFGIQLVLSALWSLVFFGAHWLWGGVTVIVLLLMGIGITISLFYPISRKAAYLLVAYLLWVSFATLLNIALALMNT